MRSRYTEKMTANVGGENVKETESLKTLGIYFDSELSFRKYWEELKGPVWKRIYALSHLKSHPVPQQKTACARIGCLKNGLLLGSDLMLSQKCLKTGQENV